MSKGVRRGEEPRGGGGAVSVLRSRKGFIRRSWVGEGPVSSLDLLGGQKVTELDKAAASRGSRVLLTTQPKAEV